MSQYVCAFRGRRDSYQVPLALAEAAMLDQFITDAYATRLVRAATRFAPEAVRAKVDFRCEPGIPMERIRCLWGTTVMEHLRHRMGFAPMETFNKLDRKFLAGGGAASGKDAVKSVSLQSVCVGGVHSALRTHTAQGFVPIPSAS